MLLGGLVGTAATAGAFGESIFASANNAENCQPSAPAAAPPAPYARQIPIDGSVSVPANFIGMHAHRWPGGSSPAPTYGFGTARSHDHNPDNTGGVKWNSINKAEDQYDWTHLDRWVDTHHSAGRDTIYTLYGTPSWCATSQRIDPYGQPGGESPPTDVRYVEKFIGALTQRYNGDGTRRVKMIEIWNEPVFSGEVKKFWIGTAQELAEVGAALYTSAKAVDAGVTVLWPGFVEWYDGVVVWPQQVEYGNAPARGKTGKDFADAFAFHYYDFNNDHNVLMDTIESARATQAELGKSDWKEHNTEVGIGDGRAADLSSEDVAQRIQRWSILSAAYGTATMNLYSHDGGNIKNPSENPVVSAAIDASHQRLAGKTITAGGLLNDGRAFAAFSDGSSWTV